MKLFLVLVLCMFGYVGSLLIAANQALGTLGTLQRSYTHVGTTADQWATGNTNSSFVSYR